MKRSSRAVINAPSAVKRGDIFSISALVRHEMESGFRHTEQGVRVPRDIIREFVCTYNGVDIFRANLYPGISANPLFAFSCKADRSGTLEFRWSGDNDYLTLATHTLTVT